MNSEQKFDILWKEYHYRHEHCWKLIFQLTGTAVAIAIVPYVNTEILKSLGFLIVTLPFLAVILLLISYQSVKRELDLLDKVRERYRDLQRLEFNILHEKTRNSGSREDANPRRRCVCRWLTEFMAGSHEDFTGRTKRYFKWLIFLAIVNWAVTGFVLFPEAFNSTFETKPEPPSPSKNLVLDLRLESRVKQD